MADGGRKRKRFTPHSFTSVMRQKSGSSLDNDNDNDNDLFRLGGLLGLYVDLYVSDSCLMNKHASTAPPQIQYYILHLLNGCSTINSTTVRLLGLLSDVS